VSCRVLQCLAVCFTYQKQAHSYETDLTKVQQCGASVVQCLTIAVCCSVLQCVAVCCSVLQLPPTKNRLTGTRLIWRRRSSVLNVLRQCIAVCCSVFQFVAVCCSGTYQKQGKGAAVCCKYVVVCCSVLQCAAVCCRVLQCAAVCCSVRQSVVVCCSVLQLAPTRSRRTQHCRVWLSKVYSYASYLGQTQGVAECCSVLQCIALCCSVLQYVAMCCSVLHRVAACCSVLQRSCHAQAH